MFNGKETLLEDSLNSVVDIAEESGLDYEIVIVNTTMIPINSVSTEGVRSGKPLKIADYGNYKRGEAKNEVLKNCSGTHIVIFDPERVYDPSYADILYNFVKQREKRMLFSEIIVIPKEIIVESGGWKNLSVSEDLELFARISRTYGILFFITEGQDSIERFLIYKPSQIFYNKNFRRMKKERRLSILRDMFLGCNYNFGDIILLSKENGRRLSTREYISLLSSYLRVKLKSQKDKDQRESNFTLLMESMFESVILQEYDKLRVEGKSLNIKMGKTELDYLNSKSEMFPKISKTLNKIMERKN